MANIDSAKAVRFSNEVLRVAADKFAVAYAFAVIALDAYAATDMSDEFPNDGSPVIDGSESDGRNPVTGADANALIAVMTSIRDQCEANDRAILHTILRYAVHPQG